MGYPTKPIAQTFLK